MAELQTTRTIRFRLIGVVSLILVIGFAASNLLSYQASRDSVRASLIEGELPLTSDTIFSEIQRDLLQPVFIASLMANDTFLKDWILSGEENPKAIYRYLNGIKDEYGVFTSFLIPETSRRYYHFTGESRTVRSDQPEDSWYFRVQDLDGDYEINLDINQEQEGELTVFINHRILDYAGNFLGVTGIGLDLSTVNRITERYREDFGRHIYFVDQAGQIKARSYGAAITADNLHNSAGVDVLADTILSQDRGFFEYDADGETFLMTMRYIPELKWRVLVEQSEAEALAGIRNGTTLTLIIGFVVVFLTIVAIAVALNVFNKRLELMATTDSLTGLSNRHVFDLSIDLALKRKARDKIRVCILMIDIDYFKNINDHLGHVTGDKVLKSLAVILQTEVRQSDVLCRWGGEEFAVLAQDCGLEDGQKLAEKIRDAIAAANLAIHKNGDPITASVGVAEVSDTDDATEIIRRADAALYAAKSMGRNCVRIG